VNDHKTLFGSHVVQISCTFSFNIFRLDRCSSNDSGLGNSLSPNSRFIETSNLNQSQPEADSSTGSEDISPEDQSQPVRKRFPRLGLSSLSQNLPENNSNQPVEHSSGSSESSESDDPSEPRPRTSTPQQSPLKPCAEETPMLPDFMNPCVSQGQPLPSIEDLLYPGINNKPPQNTVLNSSKKMLKNVKSKTSAGLSKMKMSISELVKTERAEAELQRECFEKITKFAADSAEDDFSIHMIEEASLQRLTAVKPVLTESLNNRRGVQFPPVGSNEVNSKQMSPLVVPKVNQARRVRKSRQTALALQTAKRSDSKTSKRRRMISEVRKRVQEAHQEPGKAADVRVPKCYRDKKPVYLKQGQIPQYRNGQLDWNYLWFFSDSSTTTNSTSRDQTLNTSSPTNETSESDSEKPVTPKNRKSSRGTSGYTTPNQKTPPKPETPTSIMREAKKKRIRRLVVSPPKDDNVKLLGMM
jgi:hypothetical protein